MQSSGDVVYVGDTAKPVWRGSMNTAPGNRRPKSSHRCAFEQWIVRCSCPQRFDQLPTCPECNTWFLLPRLPGLLFHTQASRWQSTTIATYTYMGSTHVWGRQSSVGRENRETESETRPGVGQLLSAVLFCTIKTTADRNRLGAPRGIATHVRFAEIKDDKIRGPEAGNLRASWWATGRATRENDDTRLKKVKSTACGRVDDRQPKASVCWKSKTKSR
ncbi:hypothetical protein BDV35DRAFT_321675 [Aspergillus flavus]|uniref:Uncharacterized protein n=1 Tax=Aspergillus flavus TaxID=5059 RepID=A0A5N6GNT5_ASPFL|nr:hypothetical protein BDV35DRAFT_321675 [Aspergillus flavus]